MLKGHYSTREHLASRWAAMRASTIHYRKRSTIVTHYNGGGEQRMPTQPMTLWTLPVAFRH